MLIFAEEFEYDDAPTIERAISSTIGLTILHFGTDENKATWIPKIVAGEAEFALGYSEPDAGTDLASLKTRAELDGDEWVINGQKIWNSVAHYASHEWLAVRTDPDAKRHAGISIIVVPLDSPGITIQPLHTWPGLRTNATYFEDVRVPRSNLIGEVNQGWTYVSAALAFERANAFGSAGHLRRVLDELEHFCRNTVVDGQPLIARVDVQLRLAELEVEMEIARLLAYRTAAIVDSGRVPEAEGAMVKVYTSEFETKLTDWGMELAGLYGQLAGADPAAPGGGRLERVYRVAPVGRFGAGTNEIQRDIIAQRGLGLPRGR
jgi:alkylation response protein AidB-like acyl-CoA dehydrogenase